jgi:hypothetical protein
MVKIKIEKVIDKLDSQIRKALVQAVTEHLPDAKFDERELFKSFKKAVVRKCSTWETVPDNAVETK